MRLAHRVPTSATPAQVWGLLSDPRAWPTVVVSLRGVRGAHGRVAAGQRLMALARFSLVAIPVDVVEVVPEQRLVLLVHTAPGLREQLTFELTPTVRGGSDIAVSLVLDGPLARPALLPMWLAHGLTARLLAARTDRLARQLRRQAA